ncbi:MAG: hypothetical protein DCC49_13785, partial [Acidobacteria bacterium]
AVALEQIGALETRALAMKLELIAAMDDACAYEIDGVTSVAGWLQMRFNILSSTANELVRVARKLRELPATRAAVLDGEISYDVARHLTHFVTEADELRWLEEARGWSAARARHMASRLRSRAEDEVRDPRDARYLKFGWSQDGRVFRFNGRFDSADGAVIEESLVRVADKARSELPKGERPSWRQSCADALTEIASGRLGSDSDRERASVNIHVDYRDLLTGGGSAEIGSGIAEIETARRHLCDCVARVMIDGEGRSQIAYGRAYRTAPPHLSLLVKYRDITCRFPGCDRSRWCKVHHIVYWEDGGTTDLENLVWLCHAHHIAVHEGGWRIEGTPSSGLRFISPSGRHEDGRPPKLRVEIAKRLAMAF